MKSILHLLILASISFTGKLYCQKDCKLEIKNDQFTGKKEAYTKDVTLMSVFPLLGDKKPWNLNLYFSSINDTAILVLAHQSQLSTSAVKTFYAKFTDGTVFTKEYSNNSGGEYNTGHGYTYEYTQLPLTKEELEKFANNVVQSIRVVFAYFPDEPSFDKTLEEKKTSKIREYAKCLLNETKK